MALIPKKTKFRVRFRNKTKSRKITINTIRQQKPVSQHGFNLASRPPFCPRKNVVPITLLRSFGRKDKGLKKLVSLEQNKINKQYPYVVVNKKNAWLTSWHKIKLYTSTTALGTNTARACAHSQFTKPRIEVALKSSTTPVKQFKERHMQLSSCHDLLFGIYGFCATHHGIVGTKFLETVRLDMAKALKKNGRIWLRICCDTAVTARPVETRMGKGKGAVEHWEAKIRPGQLIFEFSGMTKQQVISLYENFCKKAPIKCKLISKNMLQQT